MNTEQIQQQMDAFRQYESYVDRSLAVYSIGFIIYFLFSAATGIHCASKGPEKNNASWMMLILFIPIIGALAYWIFRPRIDDDLGTGSGVFPAPATRTSRNVADEIMADLDKRKRP